MVVAMSVDRAAMMMLSSTASRQARAAPSGLSQASMLKPPT